MNSNKQWAKLAAEELASDNEPQPEPWERARKILANHYGVTEASVDNAIEELVKLKKQGMFKYI